MADTVDMDFWINVKAEIKRSNTTQEWVAQSIDVRPDVFSRWIQRNTMPRVDQAVAIAQALNTSVEYLVTGVDSTVQGGPNRRLFDQFINNLDEQDIAKAHKILIEVFSGEKKETSTSHRA